MSTDPQHTVPYPLRRMEHEELLDIGRRTATMMEHEAQEAAARPDTRPVFMARGSTVYAGGHCVCTREPCWEADEIARLLNLGHAVDIGLYKECK